HVLQTIDSDNSTGPAEPELVRLQSGLLDEALHAGEELMRSTVAIHRTHVRDDKRHRTCGRRTTGGIFPGVKEVIIQSNRRLYQSAMTLFQVIGNAAANSRNTAGTPESLAFQLDMHAAVQRRWLRQMRIRVAGPKIPVFQDTRYTRFVG